MPLYPYECPKCGPFETFATVATRDEAVCECGVKACRRLAALAPIANRGLAMSGDEARSRGMHDMLMRHKAYCEEPAQAAMIREHGIDLRGPSEYHPDLPRRLY